MIHPMIRLVFAAVLAPTALAAAEPDPAPDPRPTDVRARFIANDVVVRSGPGESFSLVGVFDKGESFPVEAKKGDWLNLRLSDSGTGWVHMSLCETYDDLSHLEFTPNPRLYSRVGSIVLTATASGYSFDRKSNSVALGARLGYYLFDFLEVEGGASFTRIVRPAEIVESLFDLTLEEERFDMLYYSLNVTGDLLPGRQMVPFLTAGAGASIMQGKAETSVNLGAGVRVYVGKRTAMRFELRNYRFSSGPEPSRRSNSNFEFLLGTSFLL